MSVNEVYQYIINDVMLHMKNDGYSDGIDEQTLIDLQTMWEQRLKQYGPPVEVTETESQPSIQPISTSTTSTDDHRNALNSLKQLDKGTTTTTTANNTNNFGRPSTYMPPITATATTANNISNSNSSPNLPSSASLRSIMNPLPQNDGSNDSVEDESRNESREYLDNQIIKAVQNKLKDTNISQLDGGNDDDDDFDDDEVNKVDQEDSLNSDLDDDDDDDPDPAIEHYVLCQYEKVTRVKNKRKCIFKDGVMHLNGKDLLFHKANGEVVWI
ncbi:hypothetical protein CYY_008295 [Polysphondylium violaceum]|uniref:Transcription factor IIA n=1 Tax=Polysphondylium violaceum TaxID=133409 RepID=A0A8J4V1D5_9MYCE|nr:hypothetical protein CYY_008295 [Polysphondylium violaceum]